MGRFHEFTDVDVYGYDPCPIPDGDIGSVAARTREARRDGGYTRAVWTVTQAFNFPA